MFECVLLKVSLLNIQIFKTFREIGTCQYIYACSINKFIFINYISTTCRDASSDKISVNTSLQLHSVDHCAKTSESYHFKELIFQFWKILSGCVYIDVKGVTDD